MSAEAENPSLRDERSTAAYNESKVSSPGMLERLRRKHTEFQGDWSQLERLVRNLDADAERAELKPEERLSEWNAWALEEKKRREFVHLEMADLHDAHLEGAYLPWAHLEGAELSYAHLEGATLGQAHLEEANLIEAHLEGAEMLYAHLEEADLYGAHLEGAVLYEAHLERAKLQEAVFDQADVRNATGLRFNDNSVFRVRIEGDAKDPWSVLRRKYTGPWFFVHLLLLVAFFTPYVARFLYLSAMSNAQEYIIERARAMESQAERFEQRLAQIAAEHENAAPWLPSLAQEVSERRRRTSDALRDHLNNRFTQRRAVWVLVGWTEAWWAFAMAAIVVAYNACRAVLTLRVSSLRDAEERSQVTPELKEYRRLYTVHRYARWLLCIALAVTVFNVGRWVWQTRVYTPKEVAPSPAESSVVSPETFTLAPRSGVWASNRSGWTLWTGWRTTSESRAGLCDGKPELVTNRDQLEHVSR